MRTSTQVKTDAGVIVWGAIRVILTRRGRAVAEHHARFGHVLRYSVAVARPDPPGRAAAAHISRMTPSSPSTRASRTDGRPLGADKRCPGGNSYRDSKTALPAAGASTTPDSWSMRMARIRHRSRDPPTGAAHPSTGTSRASPSRYARAPAFAEIVLRAHGSDANAGSLRARASCSSPSRCSGPGWRSNGVSHHRATAAPSTGWPAHRAVSPGCCGGGVEPGVEHQPPVGGGLDESERDQLRLLTTTMSGPSCSDSASTTLTCTCPRRPATPFSRRSMRCLARAYP